VEQSEPNAVARMLGLLGDEWTLLVVQQALLGATRFAEFEFGSHPAPAVADARRGA
jgi:DNA-binding HxlR family transcriptional regulator